MRCFYLKKNKNKPKTMDFPTHQRSASLDESAKREVAGAAGRIPPWGQHRKTMTMTKKALGD